ncbi:hypothetical protein [uncultured Pseudodesulfovibrio sp.]|uniref:hypothetical protein n=1 Tax=uncultured Pseudodesulfovibrio sp. TaxID=2035858 RepID=UPI0029C6FC81|nr:hypothetical protein [uncultured Pseudodesulfovibrio sp.]
MRQVMLMITKGTQRLPTARDFESRGILVSSAVDRGNTGKTKTQGHMQGMTATRYAERHMQEDGTDEHQK